MIGIDMIAFLQTICVVLVFLEYLSQIFKILKRKTVEDISFTYWATKITITTLQLVILFMSSGALKVYASQLLSLVFCIIVFSLMQYYHHKNMKG